MCTIEFQSIRFCVSAAVITIFSNVEQRQTKQTKMLLDDDGRVHWVQYSDDISINRMWHLVFLDCIGEIIIDKPIRRRM